MDERSVERVDAAHDVSSGLAIDMGTAGSIAEIPAAAARYGARGI
jgi:hypothetical protein